MLNRWVALCLVSSCALSTPLASSSRTLTFEERVQTQQSIERIYYSYLTGARVPFEQKVSRELLERKVQAYLGQSAALEEFWHTPVTAEMLRAETERIARNTRFPERLAEIHAALDHDDFLIQETLVRASLVERLSRNFLAADPRVQGPAQDEIAGLRQQLVDGAATATSPHVRKSTLEAVALAEDAVAGETPTASVTPRPGTTPGSLRMDVTMQELRRLRTSIGAAPGDIGPVVGPIEQEQGQFVVKVLLTSEPGTARIATYSVPKTSWEDWWATHRSDFDDSSVGAVAESGGTSLGSLASANSAASCGPDDGWSNGALDDVPVGRYLHTAVWTGAYMIVWGGISVEPGGRYDPLTDTWQGMSTEGDPGDVVLPTAVWTGEEMIVWGHSPQGTPLGARYDPAQDRWSPVPVTGAPTPRRGHTAVWTGREMIVWGGSEYPSSTVTNTGAAYDPSSDLWRAMSGAGAPDARTGHTSVWTGQEMIVWGGGVETPPPLGSPTGPWLGSGARYNPMTDSWAPITTTNAPTPRVDHTATWTGTQMIVWGGLVQQAFFPTTAVTGSGSRYDPVTDTWTPTSEIGTPGPRRGHTAIWTGSQLILWGGTSDPRRGAHPFFDRAGGIYDPSSDTWLPTNLSTLLTGRAYHTAAWTGSLMLVWGGQYSDGRDVTLSRGHRYDLASDSWTSISETSQGVPVSNLNPVVWTGTEMIAWGFGGGRYDPMTDSWRAMSRQNEPSAQRAHVSVWTGGELIVWGGTFDFQSYFDSGSRYDPVTDSWSPTSLIGAAPGRIDARAVWTGKEMILWGGWLGLGVPLPSSLRAGARYNPSTDTWRALPLLDAPPVTANHSAVWTGQELIVWGGFRADCGVTFCGDPTTNLGARYDPELDLWSTLPVPSASARDFHTASWTGREMIVIGGRSFSSGSSPPLVYDRASDTWSTLNVPVNMQGLNFLQGHSAVWTGRHLLIWGGSPFGPWVDYDRVTDTWSFIAFENAPSSRVAHSAVWTGSSMLIWGGFISGSVSLPTFSGGRLLFGQHSDDDGDGVSRCQGDCDDLDALAYPDAAETCNGRDDDCDGMVDEGLSALDSDQDGTPDSCDRCPALVNPGQATSPVCIGAGQGTAQCLEAQIELPNPIAQGEVTLVREIPGAPEAIDFELNVSSCGRIDPVEFLLNGQIIASFTEPSDSCACVPPPYHVTAGDASLLAQAWVPAGPNVITIHKAGSPSPPGTFLGTYVGWVKATLHSATGQASETSCLFDFDGGTCTQPDQCIGNATEDALNFPSTVTTDLLVEQTLLGTRFSDSSIPLALDVASLPDGPMSLCVGLADPPQLYAADAGGGLSRVNTSTGAALRDGILPFGVLEFAHDDIARTSFVQRLNSGHPSIAEIDLLSRQVVADSPFLGLQLEGMEVVHGRLYGVDTRSVSPRFLEILPASGISTVLADLFDASWRGLAYDRLAGLFYSAAVADSTTEIYSLDAVTGQRRSVLFFEFEVSAFEMGPDGVLYVTRPIVSDTELYRLDLDAGEPILVGRLGVPDVVALATVRKPPRGCVDIVKQGQQSLSLGGSCNAGPTASAGASLEAECSSPDGATIILDASGSSDLDSTPGTNDDIVGFEWFEDFGTLSALSLGTGEILGVTLSLGTHQVTVQVTDRSGSTDTDELDVNVVDTTPPTINAAVMPALLWPPNHRMVPVTTTVTASDLCGPATAQLVTVSSTEPDDVDGSGDGNTTGDIEGTLPLLLRAERDAGGHGRVYSILYRASDSSGNSAESAALALVPHDLGGVTEPVQLSLHENSRGTMLEWSPVDGALYYNVIRGFIDAIDESASGIVLGSVVCIEPGSLDASTDGREDSVAPAPGRAFFYLVEYNDGWSSSYGEPSALKPRLIDSGACP